SRWPRSAACATRTSGAFSGSRSGPSSRACTRRSRGFARSSRRKVVTSCAEVRAELVALMRGETSPQAAEAVERHLETCSSCAAERDALRRTLDVLAEHDQPEVSADARLRLAAALSDEFALGRARADRRRFLRPAFALPVAAAIALVAWIATTDRRPNEPPSEPQVVAVAVAMNVAPDLATVHVVPGRDADAVDAASRGLAWLAASQRPDGSWSRAADADRETTAAATASALLAFAADGQSPHRGPRADALRRGRDRLARLVADGFPQSADEKPVYALTLGVRALSAAYRLDHDAMSADERRGVRDVLVGAGRRIVDWQG